MKYRHELKYYLNSQTAAILRGRVRGVMRPDENNGGKYVVHNLYFDDACYSYYYSKMRGGLQREKYRVRYYNGDLGFIRLERKVKNGNLSYKENAVLSEEQYGMMRVGDFRFALTSNEPLLERFANVHRLKNLRPAVEYTYLREAYMYEPGNVRITFDSEIGHDIPGVAAAANEAPGKAGMLEVKYDNFLPSAIAGLLGGLPLGETEMSKYCYVLERKRRIQPHA